jgi:hypothetical protein
MGVLAMRLLLAFVFLSACGAQRVNVGGEVVVKHQIDLNLFKQYYVEYCTDQFNTQEEIDACADIKMQELIDALVAGNIL